MLYMTFSHCTGTGTGTGLAFNDLNLGIRYDNQLIHEIQFKLGLDEIITMNMY